MSKPKIRLNLEQQKKRAKELRDGVRAGDGDAIARMMRHHPAAGGVAAAEVPRRFPRLADAQLAIARELGLPSWPRLKAHIEGLERARRAIADKHAPPDAEAPTLHVRCGSDIQASLSDAGYIGEFLELSDPLVIGPLPAGDDFVRVRSRFIGDVFGLDAADVEADYRRKLARLDAVARAPAHRIVLWFEHDSYDQLILARVLAALAAAPPRRRAAVELICIDAFPAVQPFIGLGQLDAIALRLLWESRTRVTPAQLRLGVAAWNALRAPDPSPLFAIAAGGTPELPVMARALNRHLQELPWTGDGLSLTQRLVLQVLASGPRGGRPLFAAVQALDPLPYLGDSILYAILADMARAATPPFTSDGDARDLDDWAARTLTINDAGRALLDGERDWRTCGPRERWVGGVRVIPSSSARWPSSQKAP